MKRSDVLKGLQTHKRYSKMSQKDIAEKLGGIDNLRTELSRLENKKFKILDYKHLPSDAIYNIMLNSTIDTLLNSCQINKEAAKTCHDLSFWRDKIKHDKMKIYGNVSTVEDYKNYFKRMAKAEKIIDIIINIATIEKNYDTNHENNITNPSDGSISVRWEGDIKEYSIAMDEFVPDKLKIKIKDILNQAKQRNKLEYYPYQIILTPMNNNYNVIYEMLDEYGHDSIEIETVMSSEEVRRFLIDAQYIYDLTENIFIEDRDQDMYYRTDFENYMRKVNDQVIKIYSRWGIIKALDKKMI